MKSNQFVTAADSHAAILCRQSLEKSDFDVYEENGLRKLPTETIISAVEAVAQRTPVRINSFRYFVQELVALPYPGNRAWRKRQLGKIFRRVQEHSVGSADYSLATSSRTLSVPAPSKASPSTTTSSTSWLARQGPVNQRWPRESAPRCLS